MDGRPAAEAPTREQSSEHCIVGRRAGARSETAFFPMAELGGRVAGITEAPFSCPLSVQGDSFERPQLDGITASYGIKLRGKE